ICHTCFEKLKAEKTPPLSLANAMWIGKVPMCLSSLTLPEQILIAKFYVAAFIVKLFPKQLGSTFWDQRGMHRGLRGNISTYRLDPSQVADVVDGRTLPPPARILSVMIGITFVTPKGHVEPTMPEMFRVCRERVRAALLWLKEQNSLYADIRISDENLQALPIDGVPLELAMTAKVSNDVENVGSEHNSYVPAEEDIGERVSRPQQP
ncbi:hypothetical protein JOM56_006429, partial [Amanita muscaria]